MFLVAGVSQHHCISQWKTAWSYNESDDNLGAIWSFISTVTKLSFPFTGGITLKVGAVKVLKQHIECYVKQTLPSPGDTGEEILFVFDNFIKATIELIFLYQRAVFFQQVWYKGTKTCINTSS